MGLLIGLRGDQLGQAEFDLVGFRQGKRPARINLAQIGGHAQVGFLAGTRNGVLT